MLNNRYYFHLVPWLLAKHKCLIHKFCCCCTQTLWNKAKVALCKVFWNTKWFLHTERRSKVFPHQVICENYQHRSPFLAAKLLSKSQCLFIIVRLLMNVPGLGRSLEDKVYGKSLWPLTLILCSQILSFQIIDYQVSGQVCFISDSNCLWTAAEICFFQFRSIHLFFVMGDEKWYCYHLVRLLWPSFSCLKWSLWSFLTSYRKSGDLRANALSR